MEKQLSPEELEQIKSLQKQIQQVTLQLGAVEVKKIVESKLEFKKKLKWLSVFPVDIK